MRNYLDLDYVRSSASVLIGCWKYPPTRPGVNKLAAPLFEDVGYRQSPSRLSGSVYGNLLAPAIFSASDMSS